MIKQIWIAECDVCGKTAKARVGSGQYNEEVHNLPPDWHRGHNKDFCLCPDCYKRLKEVDDEK